jgi:type IV secretory pathway TrbF-like protein
MTNPNHAIHRSGEPLAPENPPGTKHRTSEDSNRIIAARQEFAGAFGDLARGKRNWQLMSFALVSVLGVVTVSHIRLASSSRIVPYVVEVNRLGQVAAVGAARPMEAPEQRLVASQLAQLIRSIRTVLPSAAAAGQAELIRQGYAYMAPEAAGFLNGYFASSRNDPRVLGTRLARQVTVTGVLRVPRSDVWRLQWTEVERSTQPGGSSRATQWEGYVTVRIKPPMTADAIQENPLGLYVTTINWTQVGERTLDQFEDTTTIDTALPGTGN